MTALGLEIGPDLTRAALVDDEGQVTELELGDGRAPTASVVSADEDGSTVVGDAALAGAAGPPTRDPMAALGDGGDSAPVQAMIGHVLGRATAVIGRAPDVTGVVHPDDWNIALRDQLTVAARDAGAASFVPVSERAATSQRTEAGDDAGAAAGAAIAAAASLGPIVTREDRGDDVPEPPPVVLPIAPPVSVFDDAGDEPGATPPPAPEPDPVRDAVARSEAPTASMPAVRSAAAPPVAPDRGPRLPVVLLIGAVVVLAVAAVVLLLIVTGGGSGDDEVVASSTVATTIAPTTAAEAPASTESTTSTTTSSTTTTSTSSTTSTSTTTTSSTSTTTVPLPVGTPGSVTLVETGLVLENGAVLRLGDPADNVFDELVDVVGDPDSDSGFFEVAFCFADESRFVRWGQLEVVLGGDDKDDAVFTQWFVDGADEPEGLVTIDGLGVGATVAFLERNYGTALEMGPALEDVENGAFAITNPTSGGRLVGITESLEPDAQILEMWSGDECTRILT